jgi:hypothetical protein
MTDLERLLRASIEMAQLRKRVEQLELENAELKRIAGRWHLLADIRKDTCALLRRQAE